MAKSFAKVVQVTETVFYSKLSIVEITIPIGFKTAYTLILPSYSKHKVLSSFYGS